MDVAAFARGYLSLIASNDRGRGVSVAADFLQPTLDIAKLLGANQRILYDLAPFAITDGTFNSVLFTVPPGRMWRLISIETSIGVSAVMPTTSNVLEWNIRYVPPETDVARGILLHQDERVIAGIGSAGAIRLAYSPPMDLWLNPGTALSTLGFITGAGVNTDQTGRIYVEELRI